MTQRRNVMELYTKLLKRKDIMWNKKKYVDSYIIIKLLFVTWTRDNFIGNKSDVSHI